MPYEMKEMDRMKAVCSFPLVRFLARIDSLNVLAFRVLAVHLSAMAGVLLFLHSPARAGLQWIRRKLVLKGC